MKIYNERVCCISDIHIGLHQASTIWHNITLDFAHWLKKQLLEAGIKDIIIPGDVLDDRSDVSVLTLHHLPQFFKILECFNIIILVGNHDCYYNNRCDIHSLASLNEWENITIIDKLTTITAHDKVITFCPWSVSEKLIPKSDIIFGHFDIASFTMTGRRVCERGVKSRDLLDIAPLIITGHYHGTQHRVYKDGTILYLGSPYEQNWGESMTPKGVYFLDIPSGGFDFIYNDISPQHRKIRLSELLAIGSITDDIKKEFAGNIIQFIVDIEAEHATIDNLVKRFSHLKPLEIKVEYEYVKRFDVIDESLEVLGVNIQTDMIEFIKSLESVNHSADAIKYLSDIYKRAEVLVK